MRWVRALALAAVLGLSATGCSGELNLNPDEIVAGNPEEARAVERHRAAVDAQGLMIFLGVLVVAPLGLATVIILVSDRGRRAR
jgi:hypothetical protein